MKKIIILLLLTITCQAQNSFLSKVNTKNLKSVIHGLDIKGYELNESKIDTLETGEISYVYTKGYGGVFIIVDSNDYVANISHMMFFKTKESAKKQYLDFKAALSNKYKVYKWEDNSDIHGISERAITRDGSIIMVERLKDGDEYVAQEVLKNPPAPSRF